MRGNKRTKVGELTRSAQNKEGHLAPWLIAVWKWIIGQFAKLSEVIHATLIFACYRLALSTSIEYWFSCTYDSSRRYFNNFHTKFYIIYILRVLQDTTIMNILVKYILEIYLRMFKYLVIFIFVKDCLQGFEYFREPVYIYGNRHRELYDSSD